MGIFARPVQNARLGLQGGMDAFLLLPPFTPASITGLTDWYDDTGMSAASWTDKVGSDPLVQATAGNRPSVVAASQNGRSVMRFDGVDNFMTSTGAWINGVEAYTIFFARVCADDSGSPCLFSTTSGQDFAQLVSGGTVKFDAAVSANANYSSTNAFLTEAFRYSAAGVTIPNKLRYWLNGIEKVVDSSGGAADTNTGSNTFLLGSFNGSILFAPMDVGEIIIYNRALTPAEIGQVSAYLKTRWGTP